MDEDKANVENLVNDLFSGNLDDLLVEDEDAVYLYTEARGVFYTISIKKGF